MREILILTDYKGIFGSKQFSPTYRGGMDVNLIVELFGERGYNVEIKNIFKIETDEISEKRPIVLYTSSEDKNGLYKSYIEDIIFHLEKCNYYVLPSYAYLRAHNNKVAMELIRERSKLECIKTVKSRYYGAIEELNEDIENITFPVVIKSSSGAMSRGVVKANNPEELIRKAKTISRSLNVKHDIKEMLRKLKYLSKYKIESFHRYKFIIQNFIEGLENDWKILVYGNKCFVLYRGNRKNDFRASGSGIFLFHKNIPVGMLEYAYNIKEHFNVPHISLDVGFDGKLFHLMEFQFINFGTTTLEKSPFWFEKINDRWVINNGKSDLEQIYVESILGYLEDSIKL